MAVFPAAAMVAFPPMAAFPATATAYRWGDGICGRRFPPPAAAFPAVVPHQINSFEFSVDK
uniref:Uncharacterized protein n=1 Tax=Leersia perrieri TaxID=77586 RepID=A0A0D9WET2_9ORYZ